MSYTLRGRLESRLAVALLPVLAGCVVAAALPAWWPVELAALMLAVGLVLDGLVYDRRLDYQPGWFALPLGVLELVIVMALVRALSIEAPLGPAVAFYAAAWTLAQLLGHVAFPLLRISYAEDGGELGRAGVAAGVVTAAVFAGAGGLAWAQLPPTVHLSEGIHRGPIVITRSENLVGERGAVVQGGIVIRANDVTVRDVAVLGGEYGIEVDESKNVVLDGVRVVGASLDGIHVRRSRVTIRDCTIDSPDGETQGIDISFSADKGMSVVEGCTVVGGRDGIFVDSAGAMVMDNHVSATAQHAITMIEMSMGMIERNHVTGAIGTGIYCSDQSECEIETNRISGMRPDSTSDDLTLSGHAITTDYKSHAELSENELVGNAGGVAAFSGARITHR